MVGNDLMHALDNVAKSMDNLAVNVRDGYHGMKELIRDRFFLVRDVYKNVCYPYINNSQQMNGVFTTSAVFQEILFEKEVDNITFTCDQDVLLSFNAQGTNAMLFTANSINSLNIRGKYFYIARSVNNGTCRIWGLF